MKLGLCYFVVTLGALVPVLGSPITVWIDSFEMLDELGIEIESQKFDDSSGVHIELTWKSVPEDQQIPPRLDLIMSGTKEDGGRRIHVRYKPDTAGHCSADFSISETEVENIQLVFLNGQNIVHALRLTDYLEGFPKPNRNTGFGFGKLIHESDRSADKPSHSSTDRTESK